jgi:DNA ligase-1
MLSALPEEIEPAEASQLKLSLMLPEGKKSTTNQHYRTTDQLFELAVIAIKRAFSECPNITLLVHALLARPIFELHKSCKLTTGVPVAPMLAKPSKQVSDVLKRLSGQQFTMEYKYDGERAQVHLLSNGSVKIFSRNSEDNSQKYPDLVDIVKYVLKY